MKKFAIVLVILAMAAPAFAVSADVRIAQVYPGGGSATATASYKKDYVVLFNATGFDLNIGGYVLEYGSATGSWGSSATNYFVFPQDTWIAGCSYLMVACASAGTGGAAFPTTPDYVHLNRSHLSGSNGKVGLFSALNANLACGSETPGTLVDKLAYGTATCAEGTATAALTATTRASSAMVAARSDTDNNLADFAIVTGAMPNNSTTPPTPAPRSPPRPSPSARSRPSSASRGIGEGCLTAV
ncbi:MAG: lamin tail domain-containing protein [bacterium]|nr:lamin tail domain-containing protein [bacterium]